MKTKIAMILNMSKMPKSCRVCGVFEQCETVDGNAENHFYDLGARPKNCPLVKISDNEVGQKESKMTFECTCADVSYPKWKELMSGRKRFSYVKLKKMIKDEMPKLYFDLSLDLRNPWSNKTWETPTHYILTHSATEYFFAKQ